MNALKPKVAGQWRRARLGVDWYELENRFRTQFLRMLAPTVEAGVSFPPTVAAFSPLRFGEDRYLYFSPGWPETLDALIRSLRPEPCAPPDPDTLTLLVDFTPEGRSPWLQCFGRKPAHPWEAVGEYPETA
jgi:hypothetical protein